MTAGLNRSGQISQDSRDGIVDAFLDHVLDQRISLEDLEEVVVKAAIERCNGNLSAAARMLGISRSQIGYKQKKFEP
ncbi:Bacterial regulatory protein, Fis family [compost metagenome]